MVTRHVLGQSYEVNMCILNPSALFSHSALGIPATRLSSSGQEIGGLLWGL